MNPSISTTCEQICLSDSELLENFLNTFQLLSPKQQKIWRVLQWYSLNYRHVFPSHETIAKKVGCHRDTVIQAIKKFCKLGWIGLAKRCFRSCMYYMADVLKKIDTKLNDTFRVNPTQSPTVNPTLYNTYSSSCNVRYASPVKTEAVQSIKDQEKQPSEKTDIIKKMGITDKKDIWCLCRYSLMALRYAYEDLTTRKASNYVRNVAAWITNRCKAHQNKFKE